MKGRLHDNAGSPLQLLLRAIAKTALLGLVVYLLVAVEVPRVLKHIIYSEWHAAAWQCRALATYIVIAVEGLGTTAHCSLLLQMPSLFRIHHIFRYLHFANHCGAATHAHVQVLAWLVS